MKLLQVLGAASPACIRRPLVVLASLATLALPAHSVALLTFDDDSELGNQIPYRGISYQGVPMSCALATRSIRRCMGRVIAKARYLRTTCYTVLGAKNLALGDRIKIFFHCSACI